MRTLGKGVKTRGSRVVGGKGIPLFDMIFNKAGNQISEKSREDYKRFTEGKGFDDVINHYRKVQEAKEAEKAKEYAERKSRIENSENDFRDMVAKYGLKGNVGNGIFGDLFEDAIVEGGKKLYHFDKEHGSHLKEGLKSGFKNMFLNTLKGGNGIESATRFGRGNRFHVLPDVMPEYDPNDVSGWVEKERRSTGYYDRPAILGEGC
jgi:hypothetical protein